MASSKIEVVNFSQEIYQHSKRVCAAAQTCKFHPRAFRRTDLVNDLWLRFKYSLSLNEFWTSTCARDGAGFGPNFEPAKSKSNTRRGDDELQFLSRDEWPCPGELNFGGAFLKVFAGSVVCSWVDLKVLYLKVQLILGRVLLRYSFKNEQITSKLNVWKNDVTKMCIFLQKAVSFWNSLNCSEKNNKHTFRAKPQGFTTPDGRIKRDKWPSWFVCLFAWLTNTSRTPSPR